jgi:hypothetical protein
MSKYDVSRPRPDVLRVVFPNGWDANTESADMFKEVLAALDDSEQMVTLLIVTQGERPVYSPEGIGAARSILTHDNIKQMIVVAHDAELAISHMGARRGERGLPPVPMRAFEREEDALPYL